MANSETFVAFAQDLLAGVGPVEVRRMFGGHGVYAHGVMFGLLYDDELFLKVDGETRARFEAGGGRVFAISEVSLTSFIQPPDAAHSDPDAMLPWARLALDAALRARAAKLARASKPKGRAVAKPEAGRKRSSRGTAKRRSPARPKRRGS